MPLHGAHAGPPDENAVGSSSPKVTAMVQLNRLERLMMNHPLRSAVQRHLEARWLMGLGGPLDGGVALEVGCGRGVGAEIILDQFGAERVDAFDVDPRMVALARQRLARRGDRVHLWEGDATTIQSEDGHYDAVFDFGILHHVVDWQRALREIWRVLRPNGRLYCEEVLAPFLRIPLVRLLLHHPEQGRFSLDELRDALLAQGFALLGSRDVWGCCGWIVAGKPP